LTNIACKLIINLDLLKINKYLTKNMSLISQAYAATNIGLNQPTGFVITDLGKMIQGLITFALYIAFILVFVFLVWGGIEWLTSGGDKGRTEAARNRITAAIVGLAIIVASYAIVQILQNLFGVSGVVGGGGISLPKLY